MKNKTLVIALIMLLSLAFGYAQSFLYYRTIDSGDWNNPDIWEKSRGFAGPWSGASVSPNSSSYTITIRDGHTVTVTADVTVDQTVIDSGGTVIVDSGKTLTVLSNLPTSTDLDISGTLLINGTLAGSANNAKITNQSSGKIILNGSYTFTRTLTNEGTITLGSKQLSGTVTNNGTIKTDRLDIMDSSGTITHGNNSTIDYTAVLNIPASTAYKNLTLSAPGVYYLDGNLSGIKTLTLGPNTNLHKNGKTLSYANCNAPSRIIDSFVVSYSSFDPAVPASLLSPAMQKRALYRLELKSNAYIPMTAISFATDGTYNATDLSKLQLWTGVENDLNAAGQLGADLTADLGAGSHEFSGLSLALSPGETQYFWITADTGANPVSAHSIYVPALSGGNISLSVDDIYGTTISGLAYAGGEQSFCHLCQWTHAKSQSIGKIANAGSGYQVKVNVFRSAGSDSGENLFVGTDCREDFGDIRFFEGETPLNYWMQSCVYGNNASFWVKMHGDLSEQDLYLTVRYGNAGATTTSNGADTFLFFDDFNRTDNSLSNWTKHKNLDGSTIAIPKGTNYLRLGDCNPEGTFGHVVLGSDAIYNDFVNGAIEFKYRNCVDAIAEVGFRGSFADNKGYKGRSDARTITNGGQSFLTPPYYDWGFLSDSPEPKSNQPEPHKWYNGTITVYGSALHFYRDGTQYAWSNKATDHSPGEISLQNHYGNKVDYDWVAVRKYANDEPARGAWESAPVALWATAENYNGFTARWSAIDGAQKYYLYVYEEDGTTLVSGWNGVEATTNAHRVEPLPAGQNFKYRVSAVYNGDIESQISNSMGQATTSVTPGVAATSTVLCAPAIAYVPSIFDVNGDGHNNVKITPALETDATDDYFVNVSFHPDGYDIWPNGRLLATISSTNSAALNGTYTLHHAEMGFTPLAAAYRWGNSWHQIEADFNENYTVVNVQSLSKDETEKLEILLDNGSGTLPVELSSFTATLGHKNQVKLQWVTQSETNVLGFRILRGFSKVLAEAELLSAFVDATNTSQTQIYLYYDQEVDAGALYYYWLQSVDYDGSESYYGPILMDLSGLSTDTPAIPIVTGIQNLYPNPFNPSTTIKAGLAKQGNLSISIYNQKGQMVNQLVNEEKAPGYYQYLWFGQDSSGRNLPSGIYFIRMQTDNKSFTRKVVLMK